MRNARLTLTCLLIVMTWAAACAPPVRKQAGPQLSPEGRAREAQALQVISSDSLLEYVKILTSDKYAGRLTGTPEYRAAARWTADRMGEWGIEPAGEKGTFFQTYPNPYNIVFVGGELSGTVPVRGRNRLKKYVYEKDYYPGSMSGDGKLTAEVVYAGYGITAPEMEYDDYAGINVEGKIVLVEPEVPVSRDDPDLYKEWAPYSTNQYKVKMAVAHGARGLLLHDLKVNPDIDYVRGFKTAQVGKTVVDDIFAGTGKSHDDVLGGIRGQLEPASFRTRKRFTIHNITEFHPEGKGYNVLGLLRGSDPVLAGEVVILGAHLDHAGFCYEVLPGADNNASGTAVMLGVAEALAESPLRPRRSILFLALGSEEQALRGAEAYFENPAFPAGKTVAFINLDKVGAGDKLRAEGALNFPGLWAYFEAANQRTVRLAVEPTSVANLVRPRSSAAVFSAKKIPAFTFTAFGVPTYSYTTRDTWRNLTPEIMGNLARILYAGVFDLADSGENYFPEEKSGSGKRKRR